MWRSLWLKKRNILTSLYYHKLHYDELTRQVFQNIEKQCILFGWKQVKIENNESLKCSLFSQNLILIWKVSAKTQSIIKLIWMNYEKDENWKKILLEFSGLIYIWFFGIFSDTIYYEMWWLFFEKYPLSILTGVCFKWVNLRENIWALCLRKMKLHVCYIWVSVLNGHS